MKQFDIKRPEFSPYGFTCESWTPTRMTRPDRHNEIELNLMMAGSLTYLLGGLRTTIETGRLGMFWAAIPHQIVEFQGDAPYFVVTLPLGEFLRAGLNPTLVQRILQGELLTDMAQVGSDERMFRRWEQDLQNNEPVLERAAQLEVQARLLRFARGMTTTAVTSSAMVLSRADKLACYIAQNYQLPLTSQSIADAVGLHPNYAMDLFRRTFGTTITAFVVQHRISHAQRLLVTTHDAILNIALASGFQSLSRFNEAFKSACRCSPRDYRKAHQPADASQPSPTR